MNCKIPFTKDIEFEKKLYEITSISLEHEINIEDNSLNGNFIITGDFKSHEVSVNKEAFSYVLPFVIDLTEDIDTDTLEFMIDDFTYEVIENNILRVNIEFNVIASKKEIVEEPKEELFRDANELLEEGTLAIEPNKEEERVGIAIPTIETENVVEEKIEKVNEETIINSINGTDDGYATYHIHMVSDGESVETICTMYNSNLNILSEYNDLGELNNGDKLIIPDKNE